MLERIIMRLGHKGSIESMLYINRNVQKAKFYNDKATEYPEQRYYPVGHPRKLLIEKRNDCYNAILFELKSKWHDDNGNSLFSIPKMLRPYQENVSDVTTVIKQFLVMERSKELNEALKLAM